MKSTMSIFSKKGKPKESEVKSKQQQYTANGTKAQSQRHAGKHAGSPSTASRILDAGDRTIQRAQIMAASRRRMNSSTPDYSIKGASKSHSTPYSNGATSLNSKVQGDVQAVGPVKSGGTSETIVNETKAVPQKSSKNVKQNGNVGGRAKDSDDTLMQDTSTTPTMTAAPPPKPSSPARQQKSLGNPGRNVNIYGPAQRAPSLPMDSPTLGYFKSQEDGFERTLPSSDSGFRYVGQPAFTDARKSSQSRPVQQVSDPLPRVDNGFVRKPNDIREPGHEFDVSPRSLNEGKTLILSPTMDPRANCDSASGPYVSRLDPGPTGSIFATQEVPAKLPYRAEKVERKPSSPPRNFSRQELQQSPVMEKRERGRKTSKTPTTPPSVLRPNEMSPKTFSQFSTNPPIRSEPGQLSSVSPPNDISVLQPPLIQPIRASTPPPAKSSIPNFERGTTVLSIVNSAIRSDNTTTQRETPIMGQTTSKSIDHSLQQQDTSIPKYVQPKAEHERLPFASTAPSKPPNAEKPSVQKSVSTRERRAVTSLPQSPKSESRTSYASERRSTLPSLAVLEGFKVNRRGQILDEEGEVIGELFEGDIIDCVRQKVNGHGDVVDEFGNPVGRVRTVLKGHASKGRLSISSATGIGHPTGPYPWARRDSNVSQQTQSQHQLTRESVSYTSPPSVDGNVPMAELDASAETEAAPVVDHSEIFSPFDAAGPGIRSESPSSLQRSIREPEIERSSQPAALEAKDGPSVAGQEPSQAGQKPARRWTSRYFESGPENAQTPSRHNSMKPDGVQVPTAEKLPSSKSTSMLISSDSVAWSRAVIGPTLESLLEQSPSLFIHNGETLAARSSSPHLPRERSPTGNGTLSGPTNPGQSSSARSNLPRPASMVGSHLSVRSGYSQHQPIKKSPLASYETTPPGTRNDSADAGTLRTATSNVSSSRPPKARKLTNETDDAAFIPDIPKARVTGKREGAKQLDPKTRDKRKSRLSFLFGK